MKQRIQSFELHLFNALGLQFDLDPCSPGPGHWVPANKIYTKEDDGLTSPWEGSVFMNPPFGGRNGHIPWMKKFLLNIPPKVPEGNAPPK